MLPTGRSAGSTLPLIRRTARITVGGLQFTVTDGNTDFALDDGVTITVPATKVNVTASWKGESSNALVIEIIGDKRELRDPATYRGASSIRMFLRRSRKSARSGKPSRSIR
jgi:hypothetical protein